MTVFDFISIAFYAVVGVSMVYGSKNILHMLEVHNYNNKAMLKWLRDEYKSVYDLPLTYSLLFFIAVLAVNLIAPGSLINSLLHWFLLFVYALLIIVYKKVVRPDKNLEPFENSSKNKRLITILYLYYLVIAGEIYIVDFLLLGHTFLKGSMIFTILLLIGNGVTSANFLLKPLDYLVTRINKRK